MRTAPDPTDALIQSLVKAHSGGPPADDQIFAGVIGSEEQAYAIQDRLFRALDKRPGVPKYWKSGGPSQAEPLRHAPLPTAGVRPTGARLDDLPLHQRWIEAELALRLAQNVTPADARDLTIESCGALVDGMCVSIELVDFRWAAARAAAPVLKLVDLLVHGALVLGEFVPFAQRPWAAQTCRVRIGAGAWQSFSGSLGVGDPAWVLPAWLRHVTRGGSTVPAGTVVTTGTWCGLLEAAVGDQVFVEFPGIGSASLKL
jgi:2-keto-4-pentenoate hydratase